MEASRRYSGISTINHWLTALLVVVMLVLGYAGGHAPNDHAEHYVMGLHVSIGFFAFLFVLWRVGFRLWEGFPESAGRTAFERILSRIVHRLLLLVLVLQVLTGPLYLFTEGEGADVFGWFTFYIPLESLEVLHEPAEIVHVVQGMYVIPALLLLHFLGAAKLYLRSRRGRPADL